jgi:hypothetical protein
VAWAGWRPSACSDAQYGRGVCAFPQGLLPFVIPLGVMLFEPDMKSRRRMLPFLAIGTGTSLYIIWALIAYPLHIFVRGDSIVYINDGTNNTRSRCCM